MTAVMIPDNVLDILVQSRRNKQAAKKFCGCFRAVDPLFWLRGRVVQVAS
jgi:hypothetical protein